MRRQLRDFISLEALRQIPYIFIIPFRIKNWFTFLLNFIGLKDDSATYLMRNGIKIKTSSGVDSATIMVSFIRKDYGNVINNATIIDIGAHIGSYSLFAATNSKNTLIYSFEPTPSSYELMKYNIIKNKLENRIIPFNIAVGAKKEKRKLFLAKQSPANSLYSNEKHERCVNINCISLKNIFDENKIQQCDLLKMDCEGAEFEILYNTPKDYLERIDRIRMEYHTLNKNLDHKSLIKFLTKHGFKIIKRRAITEIDGDLWAERDISA